MYIDYKEIVDKFKAFLEIDQDIEFKNNQGKPIIFKLTYEPFNELTIFEIHLYPNNSIYLMIYQQIIEGRFRIARNRPISIYNITGVNLKIFMMTILHELTNNDLIQIKFEKIFKTNYLIRTI